MNGVVIDPTDRFRGFTQYDVHIIAYTSLFRIVDKFHQAMFSDPNFSNGLNRSIDFRAVTLEHDRLLSTTARSGQSASNEIRAIPVRDSC